MAILGSPDLAVKLGAPINLTCVISQSADQFQFIFWYRDERMINYDIANEARGKIVVSKLASNRLDSLTSSLQIFQSKLSDSGNYTCAPSGARSTSIYVHILEGESPNELSVCLNLLPVGLFLSLRRLILMKKINFSSFSMKR